MADYFDPETYPQEWNFLQSGTIIDQYVIERELAHGGFSSVYLARQIEDQIQVAIKEYLPRKLAHRTWNNSVVAHDESTKALFIKGRILFFEEAKVLVELKHHNIVEVINFFQANSTVCMVMVYDYGISLDKLLREHTFPITEDWMLSVFRQLLDGIRVIHQHHFMHLDIKPANILIRPGNDPLLLDFGAIQPYPANPKKFHNRIYSQGYSPIEQYSSSGVLGPWTDIYAVGATMRSCLEHKIPLTATERAKQDDLEPAVKAFQHKFSPKLLQTIDHAMAVMPNDRPQSAEDLQKILADI